MTEGIASTVHASCVVVRELGVLIRGPSGSGKSTLARGLIDAAEARGWFGRLVADDRVRLETYHGRLVAHAIPAITGLLEIRGVGIARCSHEAAARIGLVVDLASGPIARIPTSAETRTTIGGVTLPRFSADRISGIEAIMLWQFSGTCDGLVTVG